MFIPILIIIFLVSSKTALASDEFNLEQQIVYNINLSGNASVQQTIKLTNNYSEIYAKEYQIILSGSDIQDINGNDKSGDIVKNIDRQDEKTIINLEFNNPAVGKNQSTQFSLNYNLPQLAIQKGQTWEISLPQHQNIQTNDKLKITLNVPQKFGKLSFSSIPNPNFVTINKFHTIKFDQQQIANQKILLVFGDYQIFDFTLKYFLKNTSSQKIQTEIAIPPDTTNQKLIYRQISPPPLNIIVDQDGNWLAQYQLSGNQETEVTVQGQVKITPPIPTNSPNLDINSLTLEQTYWPVNHPQITNIAQNLKSPKNIYDYVVSNLNYDYRRINASQRQGALFAINNPQSCLCTEFTDLFVTLARTQGIPAREVQGFAYTNNPKIKPTNTTADILHAWPQYFDQQKNSWISIDPTWAKTTKGIDYFNDLDLNHFAFVFHGANSIYPAPPGSYKNNHQTKTVEVVFSNQELGSDMQAPQISIQNNLLTIKNPNLEAITPLIISSPPHQWDHTISVLPPLASSTTPLPSISFISSLLPPNQKLNLDIKYSGKQDRQTLKYPNHYRNTIFSIVALVLILSIGGIMLTARQKKQYD